MPRTYGRIARWDPRNDQYRVEDHADKIGFGSAPSNAVLAARIAALRADVQADSGYTDARLKKLEAAVFGPQPAPPTPTPVPPQPTPPVPPAPPVPSNAAVLWTPGALSDQQQTGECEGYSTVDLLNCAPYKKGLSVGKGGDDPTAPPTEVYFKAQSIAGQPQDDQAGTDSTSVLAAAKQLGWITGYYWATTVDAVLTALETVGPVHVGTDFTNDMENPDASGVAHLGSATAANVAGGHAYVLVGIDATRTMLTCRNSWGDYDPQIGGDGGSFKVSVADWTVLFNGIVQPGDAATVTV